MDDHNELRKPIKELKITELLMDKSKFIGIQIKMSQKGIYYQMVTHSLVL